MQGAQSGFGARERAVGNESELAMQVQAVKTQLDTVLPTLATREQLAQEIGTLRSEMKQETGALRSELKQETGALRSEMKQEIGALRSEMKHEIGSLRSEMKQEIGDLRSEMKHEIGGLRAEMGGLRAEIHQTVGSAIKWGLGLGCSAILAAAALITLSQHSPSSAHQREAKANELRRSGEVEAGPGLSVPPRLPLATQGRE